MTGRGETIAQVSALTATVRVAEPLRFLLPARARRGVAVVPVDDTSSLGHVVEALGVPRTEVGALHVNGRAAKPGDRLRDGDVVDVTPPARPQAIEHHRFVLDVHLGALARRMRLLGIDVAYRNDASDDELVEQAIAEHRVLLTKDRGILRRRALIAGAYVAGDRPDEQLADVLDRFAPAVHPWSRCPACNGYLVRVSKPEVDHLLREGTRRSYTQFSRCQSCARVYWRGAHTRRLEAIVATATGQPQRGRLGIGLSAVKGSARE
jgi:uncharacterized protein with PIN domain